MATNLRFKDKDILRGRIKKWEPGVNEDTGNRVFTLMVIPEAKLHLIDGEEVWADLDGPQPPAWVYLYLTDAAIDATIAKLRAVGYERAGLEQLDPTHPDAHDFADKEVQLSVSHKEWKGKMQERFDISRRRIQSISSSELAELSAKYADKFAKKEPFEKF